MGNTKSKRAAELKRATEELAAKLELVVELEQQARWKLLAESRVVEHRVAKFVYFAKFGEGTPDWIAAGEFVPDLDSITKRIPQGCLRTRCKGVTQWNYGTETTHPCKYLHPNDNIIVAPTPTKPSMTFQNTKPLGCHMGNCLGVTYWDHGTVTTHPCKYPEQPELNEIVTATYRW